MRNKIYSSLMRFTFVLSILILISCAGTQVKTSVNKEKQLDVKNQIETLLSSARTNHQNYISELKKKGKNRKSYKYKSLKQVKKAFKILKKNKSFLTKEIINDYNQTAKLINSEVTDINFSLTNLTLIPLRYIANIGKGIADIFVIKLGVGIGVGTEIGAFGISGGVLSEMVEISTSYTPQKKKSRISGIYSFLLDPSRLWKKYTWGDGVCNALLFRDCGLKIWSNNDSKKISYTNMNVWVGLGPAFMLNIETHRFPELLGIFIGQDWNITGNESDKTQRFHYFPYKKAKFFYDETNNVLTQDQIKLIQRQIENLEKQKQLEMDRIIDQEYSKYSPEELKNKVGVKEYNKFYNRAYRLDTIENFNIRIKKFKDILKENEK